MGFSYFYSDLATRHTLTNVTYTYVSPGDTVATLDSSVFTIANYAFQNVTNVVTQINCIESTGLSYIGSYGVAQCLFLQNVINIPTTITFIGDNAFFYCLALQYFDWPAGATTIYSYTFDGCENLTRVTIPDTVTAFEDNVFRTCFALPYLNWPAGAKTIPDETFKECVSLTNITIPNTVTSITYGAFIQCGFRTFSWPNQVSIISQNVFVACTSLTSITGISSVTSIGIGAFQSCIKLRSFPLPSSVSSISNSTFADCRALTNITVPSSVTSIGLNAFNGCSSFTSITLHRLTGGLTTLGAGSFSNTILINNTYPNYCSLIGMLLQGYTQTQLNIAGFRADAVTAAVNNNRFTYTYSDANTKTNVTDVIYAGSGISIATLLFSVSSIADNAFKNLTSITGMDFILSRSLLTVGSSAFQGCSELTTMLNVPDTITSIGSLAFENTGLQILDWWPRGTIAISDDTFRFCDSLTSITIPNTVTHIGSRGFQHCSFLTSITLQRLIVSDLTTLDSNSFANTGAITSTYPKYCSLLGMLLQGYTHIDLHDTAGFNLDAVTTAVNNNRFTYTYSDANTKTNITGVTYAGSGISIATLLFSVTSIAANAFLNLATITGLDFILTTSLSSIGTSAFQGCTSLTSMTNITNISSVKSIGSSAFHSSGFKILNWWPTGTTSISDNTFQNCSTLTSVTSVGSVKSIGTSAFDMCTTLSAITIPNTVTNIGLGAFSRCGFKSLTWWPSNSSIINDSTFRYNTNLTIITIPNTVSSISTLAFDNCTWLTSILLPYYTRPTLVKLDQGSFSNTTSISLSNFSTLTKMLIEGYTQTELTTAGFNPAAVAAAAEVSCFNEDTKILCFKNDNELYVPIQDLRKGELVKTYLHGYKKIDLIGKSHLRNKSTNKWTNNMFIMYKTPENDLTEDLIMTGGHSILVNHFTQDDFIEERNSYYEILKNNPWTIDEKHLLPVGTLKAFQQIQDEKIYTYYNFSLENDGNNDKRFGIWANGIIVETPSKTQFELFNGYEYL
jgi:hypothetical protein